MSESNMNCLTYALRVEDRIGDEFPENLEWWKTPLEAISNFAGPVNRTSPGTVSW